MAFYSVDNPELGEKSENYENAVTDYLTFGKARLANAPECPKCGQFIGMLEWLPPYRVELEFYSRNYPDLIYGSRDMLVSERFKMLFTDQSLVGLTFIGTVEAQYVKPRSMALALPTYYVARVERSRTIFDSQRSEAVYDKDPSCDECYQGDNLIKLKRLSFVEHSWQGEAIFIARGLPGFVIATERFKTFIVQYKLRGIKLIPAEEYSVDYS